MKKVKEYYICDRCKKEVLEHELIPIYGVRYYELCEECKKKYDKYKKEVEEIERKYDEITKKYQFGEYLPKDKLKDSDVK